MQLDIRQIAENLILSMWGESDKLRHQAEGVRLFLQAIIQEGEKLNHAGKQDTDSGSTAPEEEQTK